MPYRPLSPDATLSLPLAQARLKAEGCWFPLNGLQQQITGSCSTTRSANAWAAGLLAWCPSHLQTLDRCTQDISILNSSLQSSPGSSPHTVVHISNHTLFGTF